MFINHKVGYAESFNYELLPGFAELDGPKQQIVREAFEGAYSVSINNNLGMKIATGKAYETAKLALVEVQKPVPVKEQAAPTSIFAGLDNC